MRGYDVRQFNKSHREVSMTRWWAIALGAVAAALWVGSAAAQHEVTTRANIEYVEHDGVKLTGDLYLPKGVAKAPLIIGVHGGGWQGGSPARLPALGALSRPQRLRHVRDQV